MRCRIDFPGAKGLEFTNPAQILVAHEPADVLSVLDGAERMAVLGYHAVGYVGYDAAPAFDAAYRVRTAETASPLACFAIYEDAHRRAPEHVGATSGGAVSLEPEISAEAHAAAVRAVRSGIAEGSYYQVNLTQRLRGAITWSADRLYDVLVASRNGEYCALIDGGDWQVISASPELFFERTGSRIVTRPMKGTAPRGRWSDEDIALREQLRESAKERAENVMIVDLVRNDLGRIAVTGSVQVDELFEVEAYPTLHQMTSTIRATVRENTALSDVFRALFPCGSITGAPKVAAMAAIAELEPSARGVYCGAVGIIRPGGDCTFNVAIRTLVARADRGTAVYGVGGGITWDSVPASEHAEMLLKARMLVAPPRPEFELLETVRLSEGVVAFADRHLGRISASARYFGFADPSAALLDTFDRYGVQHGEGTWRLRIVASRTGKVDATITPYAATDLRPSVCLDLVPADSSDVFLHHKTTHRKRYDAAALRHPEAWDTLLTNERGELTEFTRGNLVVQRGNRRVTPPLASGLLGGIHRGALLERGELEEAVLTPEDLDDAERIWFINALRGWVEVELDRRAL